MSNDDKNEIERKRKICKVDGALCNLLVVQKTALQMVQKAVAELKEANQDLQDDWREDE